MKLNSYFNKKYLRRYLKHVRILQQFKDEMEGMLKCFALFVTVVRVTCVANEDMTNETFKRQCVTTVTGGVTQTSRNAVRCAQACTFVSPIQCHGFIYDAPSRSCQLLPRANVSECLCATGDSGIHIMVYIQ